MVAQTGHSLDLLVIVFKVLEVAVGSAQELTVKIG